MLCYEWIITVSEEVDLFWTKKKSMATALFLLNRYAALTYALSDFYSPTNTKVSSTFCIMSSLAEFAYLEVRR